MKWLAAILYVVAVAWAVALVSAGTLAPRVPPPHYRSPYTCMAIEGEATNPYESFQGLSLPCNIVNGQRDV